MIPTGRLTCILEDNIKLDCKEIGQEDVDGIDLLRIRASDGLF
jgi:hypothetical protein